ncbi:MAG: hydrogenase maturation protease [Streptosporangiaceae bacterium]
MTRSVLIAGVGNLFLSDDAFGVEVVRRLADDVFPEGVTVADFGISGVHLAYELLGGYDTTILVDAVPRGEQPGTVHVLELAPEDRRAAAPSLDDAVRAGAFVDAHGMEPQQVFALLEVLGGGASRVFVVGCEPVTVEEGMGLSEPVAGAVDGAVRVVRELVAGEMGGEGPHDIEIQEVSRAGGPRETEG